MSNPRSSKLGSSRTRSTLVVVVVVSFVTASGSGSGAAAAAAMGRGLATIWVMVLVLVAKRMVRYLNCIFGFVSDGGDGCCGGGWLSDWVD